MLPNASDITYFLEIAKAGNITRAAQRLGVAQPSLSLAIRRLEGSLGEQIFTRTKKGVYLTPAGNELLKHSKNLLDYWEVVKSHALTVTNEIKGKLSLGCHPSVGLYSLKNFLPEVLRGNPHLEISLKHDLSRKITDEIINFRIDMGIVVNPIKHPDLVIRKLCEDEVTLWSIKAEKGKESSVLDYKNGTAVIICDPELIQAQTVIKKLKSKRIGYSRVLASNSLENITNLCAKGAGIGIIPTRVVNTCNWPELRRVANAPVFKDEIALIYRVENKNIETIKYMSAKIQEAF